MKRQFSRAILSSNFRILGSLNKEDVYEYYDFENKYIFLLQNKKSFNVI